MALAMGGAQVGDSEFGQARISRRIPAASAHSTASAAQNGQVSDCGMSIQLLRHLAVLHHTDSTLHALATKSCEKSGLVFEGFEGFVAEEVLDMVHVGAGAEEFGGAGAAEGVWGDVYADADGIGVFADEPAEDVIREPLALPQ